VLLLNNRNAYTFDFISLHFSEREPQPQPGEETEPCTGLFNLRGADFCLTDESVDAYLKHYLT
jgi:hypothetical protein